MAIWFELVFAQHHFATIVTHTTKVSSTTALEPARNANGGNAAPVVVKNLMVTGYKPHPIWEVTATPTHIAFRSEMIIFTGDLPGKTNINLRKASLAV